MERLKPGDKVVWYRYSEPLKATVLKVNSKSVTIRLPGSFGSYISPTVKPERVDIIPPSEIGFFSSPKIVFVEGQVTKETSYSSGGITTCHVICNGRKFTTNSQTWERIIEGRTYRLWYSTVNEQIVVFEDQQQSDFDTLTHMIRNRHKYIEESLYRGLNGPTSSVESGWDSLLPDSCQEISDLIYTFHIPLKDGSFYLGYSIPVEFDKNSHHAWERKTRVKDLVDRLTKDFGSQTFKQLQLQAINSIIESWPILVALGGEIVPNLLTAAQKNDNITSQALISRLLGDIARDTTTRLSKQTSYLLCQDCLTRCAAAHKIYLPWIKANITYYGCQSCGHSRSLINHNGDIVVVLDEKRGKYYWQDDILRVNWLFYRKMFDFDKIEIVQATDEDVERFIVQLGNNVRRSRYTQMQCSVSSDCDLSENTKRILQRMFRQITYRRDR